MSISAKNIRAALKRSEFVFHYQPKVSFLSGRVTGAEALIRWNRGNGQVLAPSRFIPIAEANGLTPQITQHMFPKLIDDFQHIHAEHRGDRLAFNISAQDLAHTNLLALVSEAIKQARIDAGHLEIEITEGTAVSHKHSIINNLTGLLSSGVQLSMDDYGTGFSSLDTLNRLPFSALKMDQSFVMKMIGSRKSTVLIKTSIAMAQLLGIKTIVEGIESEDVYNALLHYGCDEGQGYYISPPLPLDKYLSFLRARHCWSASPVGMLRMAQLTHNWQYKLLVDTLFGYLKHKGAPNGEIPASLHMGERDCSLGRWYYGAGQRFVGNTDFDSLEDPHRLMHNTCSKIFQLLQGNYQLAEVRSLVERLSNACCRMSSLLQKLENHLIFKELEQVCGTIAPQDTR